jgi:Protein-L-isoaspartate(D-aspartate) O-methyltransferase (PCMT)
VVDGANLDDRAEWLDGVYRNQTLSTELENQPIPEEIGTGYNAALLADQVGDRNVTSVNIGPALVEAARRRLADHGFHPHLSATNSARGVPERVPFDRIIATCGVTRAPTLAADDSVETWSWLSPHPLHQIGGPSRLWDLLETAHQQWAELGEHGSKRFGLTVTPDGHWVWLDAPDRAHRWPLPYNAPSSWW